MDKFYGLRSKILAGGVLVAILIFSGSSYYLGFNKGRAETRNINISGLNGGETPSGVNANFNIFWQAWSELKAKHINGKTTEERKFVEGAIKGIAGSLDDPYTTYFNPADSKKFGDDVKGSFGGIGAEIGIRNEQLIIVAPLKATPAERAELKPKDKILEIDGTSTFNLQVDEAVKLIRGEPGNKVTLTILRESWDKSKKIEIIREVIRVPTLDSELSVDRILRINLYAFNENTRNLFDKAVSDGLRGGANGMILDLRNNPGGYLDVAVDLAGWFLKRGDVVVREKFSSGAEDVITANGNEKLKDFPVVIIMNDGSASASEILAGALRDNRGVKLVGVKSFGKGTVQELVRLSDGSTLKITIANWLLPGGLLIDKNGIEPDYMVENSDEDLKKDIDAQFDKAKEILKQELNN